jgi:sulfoxide reductase heme-binding subunit YedZ
MDFLKRYWLRIITHIGALVPLLLLLWNYTQGQFIDPLHEMTLLTGEAALVLLLLSLACTPANIVLGIKSVLALRRPLGLYAFFYALLHFLVFIGLDYGFNIGYILQDLADKRYILAGLAALLLLLPLAITSTKGWIRRLGKKWKQLHRLVYLAAIFAVLHFWWLVKADYTEPLIFSIILGGLLIIRVPAVKRQLLRLRQGAGSG